MWGTIEVSDYDSWGSTPELINHDLVFCVILSETLASGACDESNVQDDFGAYWGSIEHRQAQDMTRQDDYLLVQRMTWGCRLQQ